MSIEKHFVCLFLEIPLHQRQDLLHKRLGGWAVLLAAPAFCQTIDRPGGGGGDSARVRCAALTQPEFDEFLNLLAHLVFDQ